MEPLSQLLRETVKMVNLGNQMELSMTQGHLKKETQFPLSSHQDHVEFSFFKTAHIEIDLEDAPAVTIGPMQSHASVNRGMGGRVRYLTDRPFCWINITIPETMLGRMMPLQDGKAFSLLESGVIFCHAGKLNSHMLQVFNELSACPLEEPVQVFYARSKAMELIALKLIQIRDLESPGTRNCTEEEFNIAARAAKILVSDLACPPRLKDVAGMTGVSLSRLKQVFPRVYGSTPFEFLRHRRLTTGKNLIQDKGLSASQAALAVGYSDLSPFHRAFVKKFGMRPGDCRLPRTSQSHIHLLHKKN